MNVSDCFDSQMNLNFKLQVQRGERGDCVIGGIMIDLSYYYINPFLATRWGPSDQLTQIWVVEIYVRLKHKQTCKNKRWRFIYEEYSLKILSLVIII